MTTKSMNSIAEDYFYNLNPLAKRIGEDVKATKEAYEELWNNLSLKEKNQAIDETIIQPEVALKYTAVKKVDSPMELPESYPKLKIQTGLKYIIDETGSTLKWRDEHSAPFSFMTKSQMNLNLSGYSENSKSKSINYDEESSHFSMSPNKLDGSNFGSPLNDYQTVTSNQGSFYQSESYSDSVFKSGGDCSNRLNNCTSNDNTGSIFTKLINKTSLLKIQNNPDDDNDDMEILVPSRNITTIRNGNKNTNTTKNQMNINLSNVKPKSDEINESTALLETPSSYSSIQSSQTNQDDGIPKTGFEFLDNW